MTLATYRLQVLDALDELTAAYLDRHGGGGRYLEAIADARARIEAIPTPVSYADALPGVMAAVEPVELDRPLPMPEERSCWTCAHDEGGYCKRLVGAGADDSDRIDAYLDASGAWDSDDYMPTDRTIACPCWEAASPGELARRESDRGMS